MDTEYAVKQLAAFLVALLLLSGPAVGQSPKPREYTQALNNLAHEQVECAAYVAVVASCLRNTGKSEDGVLADQYALVQKKHLQIAIDATKEAGLLTETLSARTSMAMDTMLEAIQRNCSNLSILLARHGRACKALADRPADRLQQLWEAENSRRRR